jgi:hypothetical protein
VTITIYGTNDELIEVEGCEGADEFHGTEWSADIVGPGAIEQMHVTVWFPDNGCWQVGVGQVDEAIQLPLWPVTISQHESGYSALLTIEAPAGTRLDNIRNSV